MSDIMVHRYRNGQWAVLTVLISAIFGFQLHSPPTAGASFIRKTFSDSENERFNHLVVDRAMGQIVIGAVNRLYQLSGDLELIATEVTGPKEDSPECSAIDCPSTISKRMTNNYNKALVIDDAHARLIECGSLFQGICSVRSLYNISNVEAEVKEAVVANNATASTVAFIAHGPKATFGQPLVLYVGVTYTANSPYRSEIPAVSSRSLESESMFQIARSAVTTGTRMFVNSLSRERYPIHYVYGFSSQGFSYFLTVQLKSSEGSNSEFISKLVRVCQEDQHYYSYTEIPIDCIGKNGAKYNLAQAAYLGESGPDLASSMGITTKDDVLYVVFSVNDPTDNEVPFKAGQESALCIYSLKSIRNKFLLNIKKCFSGKGDRGLAFISPSLPCTETKLNEINESFCGMDVNTPLGGDLPITSVPVLTWNTQLTSVSATSTSDYTVVFIGTAHGHLKKVVIESKDYALEYADISIDEGSPVSTDMLFDANHQNVYVMTQKKLSKVKVQDCSMYERCGDCLGARDPYCGWCSLENKCSLLSNCQDAAKDPLYWISYKDGRCTTITSVSPHELQHTTARTLQLVIDNLPNTLQGTFKCSFTAMGRTLDTVANRTNDQITCPTPRTDLLPYIHPGSHYFTSILSVKLSDGHDFVATNFTFFDCNTYSSCTECVSSQFPCDWCVDGLRCTHDTAENCRNDILVTGLSRVGPSIRSGPSFCPRINATSGDSTEILVTSGAKKQIRARVDNVSQMLQTRFVCQFNIEGRIRQVSASVVSEVIYCDQYEFSYTSPAPNITVPFAVIWSGSKPLDNPDNIHVLVYRCREMSDNCGMCLALEEKYACGWCQSSGRCEVKEQCENNNGLWLARNEVCPNPEVTDFTPKYGPWEAGTNITIMGFNLGKTLADIYAGIMVAGYECQPYEDSYIPTRQVSCRLDSPGQLEKLQGPVVVNVGGFRGESKINYKFVNPVIESIEPRHGPMSGGTKLIIRGQYMNAGSTIKAFIRIEHTNSILACKITKSSLTETECVTSASKDRGKGILNMEFDRGPRKLDAYKFEYVHDPEVLTLYSGPASRNKIPKGIPAGGIQITVTGTHFKSVAEPKMYLRYKNRNFYGDCQVFSETNMKCKSPAITVDITENIEDDYPINVVYGFNMDAVTGVQNLSLKTGMPPFLLFPNPYFEKFEEEVKHYKSDYLTINGRNLDRASQESDVIVRIGTSYCNVTSLSKSQLTCRPPSKQPPALLPDGRSDSDRLPEVVVQVGDNLVYHIGNLSYSGPGLGDGPLPKSVIIGVTVGGAVLVLIVIFILIAYRRKTTESSRVLKNMKEQMDVLELQVAAECKEAFAELQTEMTDLTGDITSGGIPFLDYRSYSMKILFPNIENHPVLPRDPNHPNMPDMSRRERGVHMFNQLIMNKTFLLLFIRTLESNRYFTMRDRVNVASLLMVTLQSKMEYCTDILKTLLAELIEKYMDGKNHPKLLLRRTEFVAEKMLSAWFTFLLYKFLRECAGEPLYMLYRAIKQQIDKGPVDAVTNEARYSLSEEKLIRQSIDYKPMHVYVSMSPQTIYVSGLDPHTDAMEFQVKVLDCDTISQVKEKSLDVIYRSTPFAQRPSKDDLDLEWRTGTQGRVILYDEDSTTKIENGWKRYNMLSHYRVPDSAYLTLIPKQSSMYNLSFITDRTLDKSHKYETLNLNFSRHISGSPTMSRATSPLNHDHENGFRYWHLVRHHDHENQKDGERGNKMVSEIYLTRLLATKGTLQKFVDDLFETIFSTAHRGSALPLAIKYMFDFLDDQALHHGITDPEVVHTWKSNSLPLRFWVNLIKNPNFVFDINKSNIVDSCLSVVAQTFMDSCSKSDHRLGKDSPSSKLLYAKDIPEYRNWVERYYEDIKGMPAISDQDMNAMLAEESRMHTTEFNINAALQELYAYVVKYNDQIMMALTEDEFAKRQKIDAKLEQIHNAMACEGEA